MKSESTLRYTLEDEVRFFEVATDETMWTQYATAAISGIEASTSTSKRLSPMQVVLRAESIANTMLEIHRSRWPRKEHENV